jgi:hypothetical protein
MLQWKNPRFLALLVALAGLSALLGEFGWLLRNFGW